MHFRKQPALSPTSHTPTYYATISHIPSTSGSTLTLFTLGQFNNAVNRSDDVAPIIRSVSTQLNFRYCTGITRRSRTRKPNEPISGTIGTCCPSSARCACSVRFSSSEMGQQLLSYFEDAISTQCDAHFFKAKPTTFFSTPGCQHLNSLVSPNTFNYRCLLWSNHYHPPWLTERIPYHQMSPYLTLPPIFTVNSLITISLPTV